MTRLLFPLLILACATAGPSLASERNGHGGGHPGSHGGGYGHPNAPPACGGCGYGGGANVNVNVNAQASAYASASAYGAVQAHGWSGYGAQTYRGGYGFVGGYDQVGYDYGYGGGWGGGAVAVEPVLAGPSAPFGYAVRGFGRYHSARDYVGPPAPPPPAYGPDYGYGATVQTGGYDSYESRSYESRTEVDGYAYGGGYQGDSWISEPDCGCAPPPPPCCEGYPYTATPGYSGDLPPDATPYGDQHRSSHGGYDYRQEPGERG